MTNLLDRRLALLAAAPARPLLGQGLRGIERETLRVTPTGQLATTPHPAALGSPRSRPGGREQLGEGGSQGSGEHLRQVGAVGGHDVAAHHGGA